MNSVKKKNPDFPSSLGLSQIQFTSKEYVITRSSLLFHTSGIESNEGSSSGIRGYNILHRVQRMQVFSWKTLHIESSLRHEPLEWHLAASLFGKTMAQSH